MTLERILLVDFLIVSCQPTLFVCRSIKEQEAPTKSVQKADFTYDNIVVQVKNLRMKMISEN